MTSQTYQLNEHIAHRNMEENCGKIYIYIYICVCVCVGGGGWVCDLVCIFEELKT
jgi:hypothetical protein